MVMEKGSGFLLRIADAGGAYTTVAGLRTTQLSINGEAVNVTNKGSGGWRELLSGAGVRSGRAPAGGRGRAISMGRGPPGASVFSGTPGLRSGRVARPGPATPAGLSKPPHRG